MAKDNPIIFSRADLVPIFDGGALLRGEQYQEQGRVHNFEVTKAGRHITSVVQGSQKNRYKTNISLFYNPKNGPSSQLSIQGICSCYVGYNCKHVAATLFHMIENVKFIHFEGESEQGSDMVEYPPEPFSSSSLQAKFLSSPPTLMTNGDSNIEKDYWISFLERIQDSLNPPEPSQFVSDYEWYTDVEEKGQYDWFGFELGILVDGQKINVLPLLVSLILKNRDKLSPKKIQSLPDDHQFNLQLPDKRYIAVEAKRIKDILFVLVELYDSRSLGKNNKIKVDYSQAANLLGLQQALKARWMGNEKLKKLGEKLINFAGIESCAIPKGFKGQLRAYQKEGFDWLNFLREFQLGGILADDMGLGKTIQVLTHLLAEKEAGRQTHPNLIMAPTSLMANWYNECQRFTPDLKVLILQGADRHANFEHMATADIILSTYPLVTRDKDILLKQQFYYLILDEAQYVKNPKTKSYQLLLALKANHTLCMTGTPMENHLGELWALFNFTAPGLLGDAQEFKRLFRDPIEKEGNIVRQKSLAHRVKPFMLRRTKSQVATELPEKTEIIHHIELNGPQLDLYESIRLAMHAKVASAVKKNGFASSQIVILDALLKLRQTCNDPQLLSLTRAKEVHHSAKREFLIDMLETLIEEGRKILLFSSFTSMLAIIENTLKDKNIDYVKLTGQTKDRVTPISQFQEGSTPIMLISLKAGGVGLNLTAADTVIHYDPWWNPAAEAQATDRAHRIGQTKPVFVYKLVCKGTVEEKILMMQENKKQLLQGVFTAGDNQNPKLSAKDLEYLFEPVV